MNRRCLWTDDNLAKLAEHDVTPEEFEEAIAFPSEVTTSRSSGLPAVKAWVRGRLLFCVYESLDRDTIYPVTAYDIEQ